MKLEIIFFLLTFCKVTFAETQVKSDILEKLINAAQEQPFHKPSSQSFEIFEDYVLGFPEVETAIGSIIGSTNPESHGFYSIPYAEAPIGNRRFQPPVPASSFGFINASSPDNISCYEYINKDTSWKGNYSEDCLRLNIHVPSSVDLSSLPTELLPVMFWIHGGAFFFGSGAHPLYDARWLSNYTNTIVVTVNYRLGPFGFLVYKGEGNVSFEGNQGIKDQQLALTWVYNNIEKFGGNKEMITVFGESAGAQSTAMHLMSNHSKPLFKRGIMQSYPASFYFLSKEDAQMKAEALLNVISCTKEDPIECFRAATPEELIAAHRRVALSPPLNIFNILEPYRAVIDEEFPYQPLDFFNKGLWQTDKEVIIGTLSDEGALSFRVFNDMDRSQFESLTKFLVGPDLAPNVIDMYLQMFGQVTDEVGYDHTEIMAQIVDDMVFVCPTRLAARFMSETSTASNRYPAVYLYVDSHTLDDPSCRNLTDLCDYAFHASELPFLFDTGPNIGYTYTENDTKIVNMFSKFWGNFAYQGKPTEDVSEWPYYTKDQLSNPTVLSWSNIRITSPKSFVEDKYSDASCNFWDELDFYFNLTENAVTETSTSVLPTESMETVTESIGTVTIVEEMQTTSGKTGIFSVPSIVIGLPVVYIFSIFKNFVFLNT